MLQSERHDNIILSLMNQGYSSTICLANKFKCSSETIRRDFEILESKNIIKKVHGGAILTSPGEDLSSYAKREKIHKNEKIEVAKQASRMVIPESIIAMNSGTCTHFIARELKENFSKLTMIVLSLPTINELATKENFQIVVPGGVYHGDEKSLTGPLAEASLNHFHIDIAFIAPGGISLESGITEYLNNELPIERILLERAEKVYIVAEHQKIDKKCILKLCDIDKVDAIITDSQCPDEIFLKYKEAGVSMIRYEP